MEVVLRVTSGPHTGQQYVFDRRDEYVVGRSTQAPFSVPEDRKLSREHFVIELNPPICLLRDLGSTNGTKVNGLRVERAQLRDGDVIVAGGSAFEVHLAETLLAGLPRIRCLACGASPKPDDPICSRPRTGPIPWLCDPCAERRTTFPATDVDYLIERRIGAGGMGEVYLARQLSTNRPVAIKMLPPTGAATQRAKDYFRREMQVLKDLLMPSRTCHRNIVTFYDIYEIDGQFQLVMEYIAGKNALEWVSDLPGPLPVATAARIGVQLLAALEYAHSRGYVHRDVKPSNILILGPPQHPQVKLSDFGLAKSFRENTGFAGLTHQGDVGGSVGFISPDHIRDFRVLKEPADIYSAGATLFYLMTFQYPYLNFDPHRADAYGIILEHPPVPLRAFRPDVLEGFERVIRKALEKQPRERWKSAAAMSKALEPFIGSGTVP
jgi:serine/threonine-protein kinase